MIIDLSTLDTTPGAASVFAPPSRWTGTGADYRAWLRDRYATDPGFVQYFIIAARSPYRPHGASRPTIVGPHADVLTEALATFHARAKAQEAAEREAA